MSVMQNLRMANHFRTVFALIIFNKQTVFKKYMVWIRTDEFALEWLSRHFSRIRGLKTGTKFIDLYAQLLYGNTVFLVNGISEYLSIPTESTESRSIEEPSSQTVIRGPKEGFSERINTNILLVRKRIKSHHVKLENLTVGNLTRTAVSLMYIENIAKKTIVREIRRRIKEIETDSILEGSYIEEGIKDDRYSIFPEFLSTEKPDTVPPPCWKEKLRYLSTVLLMP